VSKLSERRREIRAMDIPTAQEELQHLRRQLFELRLQKERGEVKNNRQFPQIKADIARLMYHLGELDNEAQIQATTGSLAVEPAEEAEADEEPEA
jgi:large subunit ribosomal protein L29